MARPLGRAAALLSLSVVSSIGCAGSPVGDSLQRSLEADPRFEEQGALFGDGAEARAEETARDPVDEDPPLEESSPSDAGQTYDESALLPPGDRSRSAPVAEPNGTAANPRPPASGSQGSPSEAPMDGSQGALLEVPEDLKPYIKDLMALNLFSKAAAKTGGSASAMAFEPNQPITRGQYANWLLTANNLFYSDQPSKKIRSAGAAAEPAFQDVPSSHPAFGAIQGLAEAGLIPSALTGNSTAVNFRPDAPLTRETLILWKVPLDSRTALPAASVNAVEATWGFQDAADIEPLALRAILADHQSGDFANILRAFGYTTLLQPQKAVTQAEAAATLWRFGNQTEGISAQELLNRPQPAPPARS